jgi:alkylhydroperoxidase family enzyme
MTTTPRIFPLEEPLEPNLEVRMAKIFPAGIPRPNLYLSLATNEALFNHLVDIGFIGPSGLLDRKSLSKQLREVTILRTCIATHNSYEFNLHIQTISQRMGVSMAQIEDLKNSEVDSELWTPELRAIIILVDELVTKIDVSDKTFNELLKFYSKEQLIEIVQLIGLYTGVAMQVALIRPIFDNYR